MKKTQNGTAKGMGPTGSQEWARAPRSPTQERGPTGLGLRHPTRLTQQHHHPWSLTWKGKGACILVRDSDQHPCPTPAGGRAGSSNPSLHWKPEPFHGLVQRWGDCGHAPARHLPQVTLAGDGSSCLRAGTVLAPRRLPRALARALPLLTRFLLLELEPGEGRQGMGKQEPWRVRGKTSKQTSAKGMRSSG